jgi:hypothetical protein
MLKAIGKYIRKVHVFLRLLVGAWNKNMSIIVEYSCIIKIFRTETPRARMFTELCKGIKHVQESYNGKKNRSILELIYTSICI